MPSKSKAQQRFMGMVHAYKKGELKGSEVSKDVKDAAKGMKKKDTKKYASTKHKGLPNKVKKEELKRLIAKYGAKRVRETVMAVRPKAVTVSGNRMPEDPDFEYDPEKVTDEGFGGELKGKDKDKFEKARIENAEQLGYKATGTSDTKKQKLKMAHELKEVSNPTSGIMMAHKKKKKHKHNEGSFKTTLRPQKKDINKMKVRFKSDPRRVYTLKSVETGRFGGTSYMFAAPGNRKERFTPKTWDLANKKGWLSLESVSEGKKRYYQQDRVGSAKYTISYHDGKKKHKDGSDFFDIKIFRNKKDLAKFVNTLSKSGYVYGFNESVNEATPKEKGNLQVMKPKFKKTFDMIYKDVASIYQNLGSVEADKLKKAYITAINKGLNPRTNMFMKNSAQKILDKAFKNESVSEAPITSPSQLPYSSPEAQKMAEKDIIGMSKILGKASQMSIKKMMDGVKAKKYDAFDLQRAIMSGPIRDTHTGERDFMRVLWNKVRSGFRRYSKRGKLR